MPYIGASNARDQDISIQDINILPVVVKLTHWSLGYSQCHYFWKLFIFTSMRPKHIYIQQWIGLSLVQVMAWCWTGTKPSPAPRLAMIYSAIWHNIELDICTCITRPQWVKPHTVFNQFYRYMHLCHCDVIHASWHYCRSLGYVHFYLVNTGA